jgi:excisionase family DNA binding protein
MAERRYLNTAEAAQLLGVSVTTVKRWVDEDILPAHKTPGGHRKILRAELSHLIRQGKVPCASEDGLPPDLASESGQVAPSLGGLAEQLRLALLAENAGEARRLLTEALRSGAGVSALADQVISPVMRQVGSDWERGKLDIHHEHRCTQLCVQALYQVRVLLEKPVTADAPLALGGCPEGDHYQLSTVLAELIFVEAGWRARNLGPNTPLASFCKAVEEYRPRVVWLSLNFLPQTEPFLQEYQRLARLCQQRNVLVMVGGRALTETVRQGMPGTTFGDGLSSLSTVARSLHSQPNNREAR